MKTTNAILKDLQKMLIDQYTAGLNSMGHMKPAMRDRLVEGFTDGVRSGMRHVCELLEVEIKDA